MRQGSSSMSILHTPELSVVSSILQGLIISVDSCHAPRWSRIPVQSAGEWESLPPQFGMISPETQPGNFSW
jgi:hypothetical protein